MEEEKSDKTGLPPVSEPTLPIYQDLVLDKDFLRGMREDLRLILPILDMETMVTQKYIDAKVRASSELRGIQREIRSHVSGSKLRDPRFLSLMVFCDILVAKSCRLLRKFKPDVHRSINIDDCYRTAKETLKILKAHPETAPSVLFVLGELASYTDWKGDLEASSEYFQEAETFYEDFKRRKYTGSFFVNLCFFGWGDQPEDALKSQYVALLLLKSSILKERNENSLSIAYSFKTLKEMLDIPKHSVSSWISSLILLNTSFAEAECFEMVNYCLTIAEKRLLEIEKHPSTYIKIKAEINCSAGEAGLMLLNVSRNRLEKHQKLRKEPLLPKDILCKLKFEKFSYIKIDEKFPVTFLKTYEEAKAVFVKSLKLLQEAKSLINYEEHDKLYTKIARAIALAYEYFEKWELSVDNLGKMQKRRVDVLEELKTKLITPTRLASDLRFIYFELGDAYADLMDVKLNFLVAGKTKLEDVVAKINRLRNLAVQNYEKFLSQSRFSREDQFSEEMSRVLLVKLSLGVVYNKLLTHNTDIIHKNMDKSLGEFKFVLNYLNSNLRARVELSSAHTICLFYTQSLPLKMGLLETIPECFEIVEHLKWATHFSFQKRFVTSSPTFEVKN